MFIDVFTKCVWLCFDGFRFTCNYVHEGEIISCLFYFVYKTCRNGDNLNSDNCGQLIVDRQRYMETATLWTTTITVVMAADQNGEKATSKNGDNESLYIHGLNNFVYELLRTCFCSV